MQDASGPCRRFSSGQGSTKGISNYPRNRPCSTRRSFGHGSEIAGGSGSNFSNEGVFIKQNNGLSTSFVALAALCWGLSGGIAGILTSQGWDPVVVSFYWGVIGLLVVVVWLSIRPRDSGLTSARLWLWSVIAGVGVAGNLAFYLVSIAEGSVAVAVTLMYCAPVFVYLASFMLKLERPALFKWAAIAMVMFGVVLLTGIYEGGAGKVTPVAAGAGLLSGLSYAVFIFGFKYAAPHGSPQAILVIALAVLTIILMWLSDADQALAVLKAPSWPLFVVLGVFGTGLSFILYIVGLKHTTPTVASIVAMVEPATASLFGVVILNETLASAQIFGMGLILLTVTALSVYSSAQNETPMTQPIAE